jgi:hypothetical protein
MFKLAKSGDQPNYQGCFASLIHWNRAASVATTTSFFHRYLSRVLINKDRQMFWGLNQNNKAKETKS